MYNCLLKNGQIQAAFGLKAEEGMAVIIALKLCPNHILIFLIYCKYL